MGQLNNQGDELWCHQFRPTTKPCFQSEIIRKRDLRVLECEDVPLCHSCLSGGSRRVFWLCSRLICPFTVFKGGSVEEGVQRERQVHLECMKRTPCCSHRYVLSHTGLSVRATMCLYEVHTGCTVEDSNTYSLIKTTCCRNRQRAEEIEQIRILNAKGNTSHDLGDMKPQLQFRDLLWFKTNVTAILQRIENRQRKQEWMWSITLKMILFLSTQREWTHTCSCRCTLHTCVLVWISIRSWGVRGWIISGLVKPLRSALYLLFISSSIYHPAQLQRSNCPQMYTHTHRRTHSFTINTINVLCSVC